MLRLPVILIWAPITLAVIIAASLPIGVEAQLFLAGGCLALMLAIKLLRLRGPFRPIFLAFGTFVILRYVFWRMSSTIPPLDAPLDFMPGIILAAAEALLRGHAVPEPVHGREPDRPAAGAERPGRRSCRRVDVFVPSYNESIDIVAPTLAAAKRMTYPSDKLNVFLLDDGGTDEKVAADDPEKAAQALHAPQACRRSASSSASVI